MKIRYSPYTLEAKAAFSNRQGALFEFTFEDNSKGYADCHPWPELGDEPIEQQISQLREGRLTPLMTRSLDFAMLDANGRSQKKNLLSDLKVPDSHFLATSANVPEEFSIYKCKDPKVCLELLPKLQGHQKIRMDFNFKLTLGQLIEFVGRVKPYVEKFDYIEDPFPFNQDTWTAFSWQFKIPFALDRAKGNESFSTRVIKPAVDPPIDPSSETRYIYTSYLDHPLGQMAAIFAACSSKTNEVCGFATHLLYKENPFSARLKMEGARLVLPTDGYGFGFDECLQDLRWRLL